MPATFGGGNFGGLYSKRKKEKLIFLFAAGFALSLFILGVVIFISKSATANKATQEAAVDLVAGTVTLFSTDRVIPAGTKISATALKSIYWPKNMMPAGAVIDIARFEGAYAKVDITPGNPITEDNLTADRGDISSLRVSPGMRAVTIEVDAKRGIEGWALPGTRVDVVLTYKEDGELTSKIAVENSRVLSQAGDATTAGERLPSGRHRTNVPTTITLEVSPKDALKLETAGQLGKLSLHLRSNEDTKASGIERFASSDLEDATTREKRERQKEQNKKNPVSCQKGKMKIEGKEYIIDCAGNLVPA